MMAPSSTHTQDNNDSSPPPDPTANILPNIDVIVRAHDDLGRELRKLVNAPALDEGRNILTLITDQFARQNERMDRMERTLTEIRNDIARENQRMDRNFQRLEEKIDRLDKKLDASSMNNLARTQNSMLATDDAQLNPLVNAATKESIQFFPDRPANIDRMTGARLRAVLGDLGAVSPQAATNVDDLRQSLRVQIGLRPRGMVGA